MNTFKRSKVVMLPTNKKSRLLLSFREKSFNQLIEPIVPEVPQLILIENANYQLSNIQSQHLYILSDEETKEGDWCLNSNNRIVKFNSSIRDKEVCKKIIACTDETLMNLSNNGRVGYNLPQIPQQFIEHFISEHNKGNVITEVMVEYERNKILHFFAKIEMNSTYGHNPIDKIKEQIEKLYELDHSLCTKLNSDNTINIKPIKDSWNREEVIGLLNRYVERCQAPIRDPKWIEENL